MFIRGKKASLIGRIIREQDLAKTQRFAEIKNSISATMK